MPPLFPGPRPKGLIRSSLDNGRACEDLIAGVPIDLLDIHAGVTDSVVGHAYLETLRWIQEHGSSETSVAALREMRRSDLRWPNLHSALLHSLPLDKMRAVAADPDTSVSQDAALRALRALEGVDDLFLDDVISAPDTASLVEDSMKYVWGAWHADVLRRAFSDTALSLPKSALRHPAFETLVARIDTLGMIETWNARVIPIRKAINESADISGLNAVPSQIVGATSAALLQSIIDVRTDSIGQAVRRLRRVLAVGLRMLDEGISWADLVHANQVAGRAYVALATLEDVLPDSLDVGVDVEDVRELGPAPALSDKGLVRLLLNEDVPAAVRWTLLSDVRVAEYCFGEEHLGPALRNWRSHLLPRLATTPERFQLLHAMVARPFEYGSKPDGPTPLSLCRTVEVHLRTVEKWEH